jgi:hypothetical protein
VLLERMKNQMKGLVLRHDWTPEVQELVHWILLESCEANCFLQDEWMILEELLAVVRGSEKLGHF